MPITGIKAVVDPPISLVPVKNLLAKTISTPLTDTIIDNSIQFKLDGIYGQTWIVTKYSNGEISINHNGSENLDGGYSAMSLEDFNMLNCN